MVRHAGNRWQFKKAAPPANETRKLNDKKGQNGPLYRTAGGKYIDELDLLGGRSWGGQGGFLS